MNTKIFVPTLVLASLSLTSLAHAKEWQHSEVIESQNDASLQIQQRADNGDTNALTAFYHIAEKVDGNIARKALPDVASSERLLAQNASARACEAEQVAEIKKVMSDVYFQELFFQRAIKMSYPRSMDDHLSVTSLALKETINVSNSAALDADLSPEFKKANEAVLVLNYGIDHNHQCRTITASAIEASLVQETSDAHLEAARQSQIQQIMNR